VLPIIKVGVAAEVKEILSIPVSALFKLKVVPARSKFVPAE
jgi:hypothetical protein